MTEQPRIAIVCNALGAGGAEGNAALLADSWPSEDGKVLLVGVRTGIGGADTAVARAERRVLGIERWPSVQGLIPVVLGLRQLVREERISHLIVNNYGLNQAVLLAKRIGLIPSTVAVAAVEHLSLRQRVNRRLHNDWFRRIGTAALRWLYRSQATLIAVSGGVAADNESFLRLTTGTFAVIHNALDEARIEFLRMERPTEAFATSFEGLERPVVIGLGRLEAQKDFPLLVEAFADALPQRGSLVIFGDGSRRNEIEHAATECGISNRLHLPGRVANPVWYLDRSDLFVLSSRFEGYPIVLLEALACGVPVVATDCPWGPAEMLAGSNTAVIVPVEDPESLAEAIRRSLAGGRPRGAGTILNGVQQMVDRYVEVALRRDGR